MIMKQLLTYLFYAVLINLMVTCSLSEVEELSENSLEADAKEEVILKSDLPNSVFEEPFFKQTKPVRLSQSTEEIGEPLTPDDFAAGENLTEADIAPSGNENPLLLSGNFEGDILDPDFLEGRNAMRDRRAQWANGRVPYVISNTFGQRERSIIARGMEEFHQKTCIRFTPRNGEQDYVFIMRHEGCYSMIGRDGGEQPLSLGDGCLYAGIVTHELLHAVGFWHEQSRADRDNYVTVMWDNIQRGQQHNFAKFAENRIDHLGESYDYDSLMHYGPYDFTNNRNRPTIVPKRQGVQIGQRRGFSEADVRKVNRYYRCSSDKKGSCTDTNNQCSAWAKRGECQKNPRWMSHNCKKSCNQCRSAAVVRNENNGSFMNTTNARKGVLEKVVAPEQTQRSLLRLLLKTENSAEDEEGDPLNEEDFKLAEHLTENEMFPRSGIDPTSTSGHFEGDIIEPQGFTTRNAIRSPSSIWENGKVPYVISKKFSARDRSVIAKAMDIYHKNTCIKFVPKNGERDFIKFTDGEGCSSTVGKEGGKQTVSLDPGCVYVGVVIHELMHAVGFWHEQSRADRDDYVTIVWENIEPGMEYNFDKFTLGEIQHLGLNYDYGSIMHYNSRAFAKDPSIQTIIPKVGSVILGQRRTFSKTDIKKINKLYGC